MSARTTWREWDCPRSPGEADRQSAQPHLGDEVGQVRQRVVGVVRLDRRELHVLAHLGCDRLSLRADEFDQGGSVVVEPFQVVRDLAECGRTLCG